MARMSRLLGAVCLGAAATAAVATVAVTREYAPVHRSPTGRAESTQSARIIVKLKDGTSSLKASTQSATGTTRGGPQAASVLGARLGLTLRDGRTLGSRTQVMQASGMSSTALAAAVAKDADVEWAVADQRRYIQSEVVNDPLFPSPALNADGSAATPTVGQWYLQTPTTTLDANGYAPVAGIDIAPAWAITTGLTTGSNAIVIADVDTGITVHPDIGGASPGVTAGSKLFEATFTGTTAGTTPYGYDFVGYAASDADNGGDPLATANDDSLDDPDPSDPGDWVTGAENSTVNGPFFGCNDDNVGADVAENSSWHGTQTGGILAAATNNGVGMASVGYNTMLVPVRALGKCGGWDSDIIAAAEWAGGVLPTSVGASGTTIPTNIHPARVINMSLGGSGTCTAAYQDALTLLRNNGVVVVAAAGNDEGLAVDVPANCQPLSTDTDQTPIVLAVAGLRQAGDKVGYSDIGPEVTIAAPAGNCINTASGSPCLYPILTTANTGTTSPVASTYTTSGDNASLGTSFATPMVTGTVALMLSANPSLTNAQVVSILTSTARAFPTSGGTAGTVACTAPTGTAQDECYCTTTTCGAGMLDAGNAVVAAAALVTPTATITGGTTVVAGSTLTLSGSTSTGSGSVAISSYTWSITSGSSLGTLSATSGSSVVLTGVAAGTVDVQLTVVDASGNTASTTSAITVTAASSTSTGSSGSSSSGGGAASPAWLAALVFAGLLLAPRARRRRAD